MAHTIQHRVRSVDRGTSGNGTFTSVSEASLAPTIVDNGRIATISISEAMTLIDIDFTNLHGVNRNSYGFVWSILTSSRQGSDVSQMWSHSFRL